MEIPFVLLKDEGFCTCRFVCRRIYFLARL
uniref:Uncharacterized protein n=1 Tax=Rhizophora mucronata TaxID=61149 RepID=A0A2P2MM58_RHIMU